MLLLETNKIAWCGWHKDWHPCNNFFDSNRTYCKEGFREYRRTNVRSITLSSMATDSKRRSKKNGKPHSITRHDLEPLLAELCPKCHTPFEFRTSQEGSTPHPGSFSPNLDCINPNLGYVKGNVQIICTTCNFAKGTKTMTEFNDWIVRVFLTTFYPQQQELQAA